MLRINPAKGISTVFGEGYVNFINETNYEAKIEQPSKDIEIMHIEQSAVKAISDIYS
jgi:hypothetical protein